GVLTASHAIAILEAGRVEEISLDHDLGDAPGAGDGYQVVAWIEERTATDPSYHPPIIHVHTSNPVARERMESAVSAIEAMVAARSRSAGRTRVSSPLRPLGVAKAEYSPRRYSHS